MTDRDVEMIDQATSIIEMESTFALVEEADVVSDEVVNFHVVDGIGSITVNVVTGEFEELTFEATEA